jgi:hypothetical protein
MYHGKSTKFLPNCSIVSAFSWLCWLHAPRDKMSWKLLEPSNSKDFKSRKTFLCSNFSILNKKKEKLAEQQRIHRQTWTKRFSHAKQHPWESKLPVLIQLMSSKLFRELLALISVALLMKEEATTLWGRRRGSKAMNQFLSPRRETFPGDFPNDMLGVFIRQRVCVIIHFWCLGCDGVRGASAGGRWSESMKEEEKEKMKRRAAIYYQFMVSHNFMFLKLAWRLVKRSRTVLSFMENGSLNFTRGCWWGEGHRLEFQQANSRSNSITLIN